MNRTDSFFLKFALLLFFLVLSLTLLHSFMAFSSYIDLSFYTVSMFSLLCVLLYYLLKMSVHSVQKQLFISLTMINTLAKMSCSVILLLIYYYVKQPADGKFIIPFLFIYFTFTIFETYFMLGLANQKP
jgi:hypothetical protein